MKIWQSLWKIERWNVSFMGEDPFFATICFNWFVICVIIVPLKLHRGINGIPISMIYILVHNDDNWAILWMIQNTNGSNVDWINLMIINSLYFDMPVWGYIYESNILTSDPPISTSANQWFTMRAVVGWHVNKFSVNLMLQFSINSEILHTLCRIWIWVRYYISYFLRINRVPVLKVSDYYIIITIIIRVMVLGN